MTTFDREFQRAMDAWMKELFPLPDSWVPLTDEELAKFVAEIPADDDCGCCPCCGCDCAAD